MKNIFKTVVFVLIFSILFSYANQLLSRKETKGWWNVTTKLHGFYNSPENEYDVMFFGSSNVYCSFNPLELWHETGLKSYVFASQQQPLWASYHYMIEALKTQSPKVMVLDVFMASQNEEYKSDGVNYTYCDPMPLSRNKIALAKVSVPEDKVFDLLFNFTKYHTRWNSLTREDFEYNPDKAHDFTRGFYTLTSKKWNTFRYDLEGINDQFELTNKNTYYINEIIKLCKERGITLMLVKTPSNSNPEEKSYFNTVERIAKENGVFYCDYNMLYEEIGLILGEDFFDATHLNCSGADKFTRYFAETAEPILSLTPDKSDSMDKSWLRDYKRYKNTIDPEYTPFAVESLISLAEEERPYYLDIPEPFWDYVLYE